MHTPDPQHDAPASMDPSHDDQPGLFDPSPTGQSAGSYATPRATQSSVTMVELRDAPDEHSASHIRRMSRQRIVGRILELNPSASPEFLAQFDDDALHDYLRRLNYAHKPRDAKARWVRETRDPGIEWRDRAA